MINYLLFTILIVTPYFANGEELISVFILYRHGNRTPISSFPTSKYQNWSQGFGALTNTGKKQEFLLGEALKSRYIDKLRFISSSYSPNNIYVRSSGVDRCLMSAETQLAGMFPPTGGDIWNANISWQPIPVQTVQRNVDYLLRSSTADCHKRDILVKNLLAKIEKREYIRKHKYFFDFLNEKTGKKIEIDDFWKIYDEIIVERGMNLTLPSWVNETVIEQLIEINVYLTNAIYIDTDPKLKMIYSGYLMYYLTKNMEYQSHLYYKQKSDTKSFAPDASDNALINQRLQIYSAHDSTIWSLFGGLNMTLKAPVLFSACVAIELWTGDNNQPHIKIYYRNSNSSFLKLKIPLCDEICTLEKFVNGYSWLLLDDPAKFCETEKSSKNNTYMMISVLLLFVTVASVFTNIFMISFYRRRSQRTDSPLLDV